MNATSTIPSILLTILVVFLIVFRSGLERLLAMLPSLFALLASFLGLRLLGGSLNIATISAVAPARCHRMTSTPA